MSAILFGQSNITARWSADLNLTFPHSRGGGEQGLILSEITTISTSFVYNIWLHETHAVDGFLGLFEATTSKA